MADGQASAEDEAALLAVRVDGLALGVQAVSIVVYVARFADALARVVDVNYSQIGACDADIGEEGRTSGTRNVTSNTAAPCSRGVNHQSKSVVAHTSSAVFCEIGSASQTIGCSSFTSGALR